MASTTVVRVIGRRRKYHWPEAQLNLWLIIMIASASTILGVFSYLLSIQNSLKLGIPWFVTKPLPRHRGSGPPKADTNSPQDLPLHDLRLRHGHSLPYRYPSPYIPTPTPARHSRAGLFYPFRALAHRLGRNEHPTVWTGWKCKQLL